MTKTAQIRARVEPEVKAEAEAVLEKLGLTATSAITMFYKQIIHHQGLPFPVALPNAETHRAIEDARRGRELIDAGSVDELLEDLDSED